MLKELIERTVIECIKDLLSGKDSSSSNKKEDINTKEEERDFLSEFIGKKVIVRDNMAGVFVTTLVDIKGKQWKGGLSRKIHYWSGAGAVQGISTSAVNESNSRLTVVTEVSNGSSLVEILPISDVIYNTLMEVKVWNPK